MTAVGGPNRTNVGGQSRPERDGGARLRPATPVTPTQAARTASSLTSAPTAPFSVYNWELFYHIPLYVAQLLSQNQQFEDAQSWFQYIFNPTPKAAIPCRSAFGSRSRCTISPARRSFEADQHAARGRQSRRSGRRRASERVAAEPVQSVPARRPAPGVAYMKSTVMSYLDNLIAWADNLFSTRIA